MIRYSANGGFNDTHLYVKYPDFAAFVGWPTDDKARAMFREQPRGERSNSDFAGGVVEPTREALKVRMCKAFGDYPVNPSAQQRPAASKLSGGRWG